MSENCKLEVKKVMARRAKSIDLMPEIQEKCSEDLSKYCSNNDQVSTVKGEELRCLQNKFKILDDGCRTEIARLTKEQNKNKRTKIYRRKYNKEESVFK